ncbi:hypothetical protein [Herbidospora cretacea]|uniref:hypothetical protein n=1 Tax=Herbidospora cretacea TaxID=28444 RepID=UPI0004C31540|nr:hypothetical protein [Herbidospora cretacea]
MSRVSLQLALFEFMLMLRSPILWAAAIVMLAWRTVSTWYSEPAWHLETVQTATAALLVGAAAVIVTSMATMRDSRPHTAELLAALPAGQPARTLAIAVAGPLAAGAVVGLVSAVHFASLLGGTPAGRFDLYEVLTGVVVAALMAALGVALTRWAPTLIVAPVLIVTLVWAIFQFGRNWLMPVVPVASAPGDISRPSGWHLGYVTSLVVLVVALALLRHGPRPARAGLAVAAAVAVGLTGWSTLTQPEVGNREMAKAATTHVCRPLDAVDYCAYPLFTQWIPLWQEVADPVVRGVPPQARAGLPRVVQLPGEQALRGDDLKSTLMVTLRWGRNGGQTADERSLAARMAAAAIGLPGGYLAMHNCDLRGQARSIVALWLAMRAGEPPTRFAQTPFADGVAYSASDLGIVDFGDEELHYARRLLDVPEAEERIWANWDRLLSPETTVADALPLLGVSPDVPAERPVGEPCR